MTPLLAALTGAASIVSTFSDIAEGAADYGYWAVLLVVAGDGVFPVLPGETAIVAAAVLASDGDAQHPAGDPGGRRRGGASATRRPSGSGAPGGGPIKRTVTRFAGRGAAGGGRADGGSARAPALVVVGRFLPGIRIAINLSCGAGQMTYPRFLTYDTIGAVLWATQAALLGYFAGKAFADQLWVAFLVAFGVTAVVGGFVALKERKRVRQEARGGGGGAQDAGRPRRS